MNIVTDMQNSDIIVIGAGIAGASVAAKLAPHAKVTILEMEPQPGYHTTGRSAAMFARMYGPAPIRALTRASESFMTDPPDGFTDHPILSPRGELFIARPDQMPALEATHDALKDEGALTILNAAQIRKVHPLLREGYAQAGLYDPDSPGIDVDALHKGFLRLATHHATTLVTRAEVTGLTRTAGGWVAQTRAGTFRAPVVVNAAGAWADVLGQMAGAECIGLVPKRRTAMIVAAPMGSAPDDWPLTIDMDEEFYVKPEAGRLLLSPANADPDVPCDVQPDEMDIALCIDRVQRAMDLPIRRIDHSWAGLRSFVADKCPVAGFSTRVDGFFWLAGQGGYGIQSSPALADCAAAMILGLPLPAHVLAQGLDLASITPERLT